MNQSRFWPIAAGLTGLLLAALDQTIVATALPAVVGDLGGAGLYSWVAISYMIASTAIVPIVGKLSDLQGRRRVLCAGIAIFVAASLLCAMAPGMLWLIAFRGLQGVGAAALTATAFAIPADLFSPEERPRYQGMFSAVYGFAGMMGPIVGGLLTDWLGWRSIFAVNIPIGVAAFVMALRHAPAERKAARAPIDWAGSFLLVAGVVPLLLALTLHGYGPALRLGLGAAAVAGLAAFLAVERRAASPILPLTLFREPAFAFLCAVAALLGASFFTAVYYLPMWAVEVMGIDAIGAGAVLFPLTLSLIGASALSGRLATRRTHLILPLIAAGLTTAAVGFWVIAGAGADATPNQVRLQVVLLGLGFGPALPLLNAALQSAVPQHAIGIATASRQFFQQTGQTFGAAVFGVVLAGAAITSLEARLSEQAARPPATQSAEDLAVTRALRAEIHDLRTAAPIRRADEPRPPQVVRAHREAYAAGLGRVWRHAALLPLVGAALTLVLAWIVSRRR